MVSSRSGLGCSAVTISFMSFREWVCVSPQHQIEASHPHHSFSPLRTSLGNSYLRTWSGTTILAPQLFILHWLRPKHGLNNLDAAPVPARRRLPKTHELFAAVQVELVAVSALVPWCNGFCCVSFLRWDAGFPWCSNFDGSSQGVGPWLQKSWGMAFTTLLSLTA